MSLRLAVLVSLPMAYMLLIYQHHYQPRQKQQQLPSS